MQSSLYRQSGSRINMRYIPATEALRAAAGAYRFEARNFVPHRDQWDEPLPDMWVYQYIPRSAQPVLWALSEQVCQLSRPFLPVVLIRTEQISRPATADSDRPDSDRQFFEANIWRAPWQYGERVFCMGAQGGLQTTREGRQEFVVNIVLPPLVPQTAAEAPWTDERGPQSRPLAAQWTEPHWSSASLQLAHGHREDQNSAQYETSVIVSAPSGSQRYRVRVGDVIVLEPEEMIRWDSQDDRGPHRHIVLLALYRALDG